MLNHDSRVNNINDSVKSDQRFLSFWANEQIQVTNQWIHTERNINEARKWISGNLSLDIFDRTVVDAKLRHLIEKTHNLEEQINQLNHEIKEDKKRLEKFGHLKTETSAEIKNAKDLLHKLNALEPKIADFIKELNEVSNTLNSRIEELRSKISKSEKKNS